MNPKIAEAIRQAVAEAGQSTEVAQKLIAWMTALTSGNEDPSDGEAASRHLELLYNETVAAPNSRSENF